MADPFDHHAPQLDSPGEDHYEVTPDDDTDLDPRPRGIWLNLAGTVALMGTNKVVRPYTLAAPGVIPFRARRVMETGTDSSLLAADMIIAIY